ncbi:YibE/F family protein, partial [Pseudomonas aeruginosa]
MQFNTFFKNKFYWIIMVFIVIFLGLFIFTFFNEKYYQMPIGKITDVQRL